MITAEKINPVLIKYIFLILFLFVLTNSIIQLCVEDVFFDLSTFCVQYFFIFVFVSSFIIGLNLKIKTLFCFIFFYQLFLSLFLYFYFCLYVGNSLGYNPIDSQLYLDIVSHTMSLNMKDFFSYMQNTGYYQITFSDFGFPFIQRLIYISAGGVKNGLIFMCICNVIFHIISTIYLYKLSTLLMLKSDAKIVALLWGLNVFSIYFNVSGLKEQLFVLIIMMIVYFLYLYYLKGRIVYFFAFFTFLVVSCFFRYYITIFFVIIFLFTKYFKMIYNRFFLLYLISLFIIVFGFVEMLTYLIPELYQAMNNTSDLLQEKGGEGFFWKLISVFLAFVGPIPKFLFKEISNSTLLESFMMYKFFLSLFVVYAITIIIKQKQTEFYPIINFIVFNVILLVVSGHFLNIRFIYIMFPFYAILIVYGIRYCKYNIVFALSNIILFFIMVLFNIKNTI